MAKPSKEKFAVRALRGSRAARTLADDTLTRMTAGFTKILAGNYDANTLLQDFMGQTSDLIDAVRAFMGGGDDTPQVIIISTASGPPSTYPVQEPVLLSDNVKGATLRQTALVGTSDAGAAVFMPNTQYDVLQMDGTAIPGGDDVEQVLVSLKSAPPAAGIYRGALMNGKTKVLAEVIVVHRA